MLTLHKKHLALATATAALAAGGLAPSASLAEKSWPSQEQTAASKEQCDMYFQWFYADFWASNVNGMNYWRNLAAARGCKWAQRTAPTTSTTTAPAPPTTIKG